MIISEVEKTKREISGDFVSDTYIMPNTTCTWIFEGIPQGEKLELWFENAVIEPESEYNACDKDSLEVNVGGQV